MINFEEKQIENLLNLNKYNREQRLAIFSDRHNFITANAGSGKTSVLIRKYLYELMKNKNVDNNPENIVAITFTKKAAAEMLKKAYSAFEDILSKGDFIKWGINKYEFEKIYRKLSKARISTIHSFCLDIIKKYPLEVGLIPGFNETEGDELEEETNEITYSYFKEIINNEDNNFDEELDLIKKFGLYKTSNYINNHLQNRFKFSHLDELYSDIENFKCKIIEEYSNYIRYMINDIFNEMTDVILLLENNLDELKDADKKNFLANIRSFNNVLIDLKVKINNKNFEDFDLNRLTSVPFVGRGSFANKLKVLGNNLSTLESKYSKGYKDELHKYIIQIEDIQNGSNDLEVQLKDTQTIHKITKEIHKRLEQYKLKENLIDFDNILYFANKLLDNPEICNDIRSNIKVFLVDEFQDTSDVQFEIVKKIVGDGNLDKIKLIIVGDEKQSIYSFRDAEIRVFKQSKEFIKEINNNLIFNGKIKREFRFAELKAINEEELGVISLNTSYRMLPHLSAFINSTNSESFEFFDNNIEYSYFQDTIKENSTDYEDFIYGVKDEQLPNDNDIIDKINLNPIEFLTYLDYPKEDEKNTYYDSNEEDLTVNSFEVKMIALRIYKLLKEGYKPEQIGVICHRRSDFNELSFELKKLNIPNIVHGNSDFFKSSEVRDIYSYLKFLVEPEYDLNLAVLLKSYFFSFSDSDLVELSTFGNNKDSLFKKLELSTNIDNKKYKLTHQFLSETLENHSIYNIYSLIHLLFKNSFWEQTIELLENNELIEDNVSQLISKLVDFQDKKSKHLSDTCDYIYNNLNIENNSETKIEVSLDKEKVNILTIHASKGLEFDILFLTNFTNQHKYVNIVGNYSNKYGYVFKGIDDDNQNIDTILTKLISIEENIITKAEKIRLLYVAMTRAKEKLIICSSSKISKSSGTISVQNAFYTYLTDFIENKLKIKNLENNTYSFRDKLMYQDSNQNFNEVEVNYSIKLEFFQETNLLEQYNSLEKIKDDTPESDIINLTSKIPIRITKEDFTATKFKNINTYPSEYFKRHILSVPDDLFNKTYDFTDFEDKTVVDSTKKGNIVHYLMENMSAWLNENLEIESDELTKYIKDAKIIYEMDNSIDQYFYNVCNNLANSIFLKNYQRKIKEFQHELGLKMPLGNSFLSCKIDLCFVNGDDLEIWDWKTDKINSEKEFSDKVKMYEYQLKTYALISYYYFKQKPKNIKAKLLFLDKLEDSTPTKNWVKEFVWIREDLHNFADEIKQSLQKANKMNFGIE